jgi:toxin YoeB
VKLLWTDRGWDQYRYWLATDRAILERINALLDDTMRSPFRGIGKPEPLRGELSGWWSRRITDEHRLVYRCVGKDGGQHIEVAQCRFHY